MTDEELIDKHRWAFRFWIEAVFYGRYLPMVYMTRPYLAGLMLSTWLACSENQMRRNHKIGFERFKRSNVN